MAKITHVSNSEKLYEIWTGLKDNVYLYTFPEKPLTDGLKSKTQYQVILIHPTVTVLKKSSKPIDSKDYH